MYGVTVHSPAPPFPKVNVEGRNHNRHPTADFSPGAIVCNTDLGGGKGGLESNNTDTHSVLPRDGARLLIRNYCLVMSLPVKMDLRLLFLSMDPANKISTAGASAQDEHFAITG